MWISKILPVLSLVSERELGQFLLLESLRPPAKISLWTFLCLYPYNFFFFFILSVTKIHNTSSENYFGLYLGGSFCLITPYSATDDGS